MNLLLFNTAWIEWGGTTLITALVFIETGFLLGLIVPGGETLLFSAGLLTGTRTLTLPVAELIGILILAAIAGDLTGYWIGRKLGDTLHTMPDNFFFKRRYLSRSEAFYRKHPQRALLLGRFLPIIRTFNPLLAATSGLPIAQFVALTATGVMVYITVLVLAGYWLGQQVPQAGQYVEYIFLGIVLLIIAPMMYRWFRRTNERIIPRGCNGSRMV